MSKKLTERVEELERRVRDLEARPIVLPIFVQPSYVPTMPTWSPPASPWYGDVVPITSSVPALPLL